MKFKRLLAAGLAAAVAAAYMPQAVFAEEQPQSEKQVDYYAGLTFYTDVWAGRSNISSSEALWYNSETNEYESAYETWVVNDAHITGDGTYTASFEKSTFDKDSSYSEEGWVQLFLQTSISMYDYNDLSITVDSLKIDGKEIENAENAYIFGNSVYADDMSDGYHGITEDIPYTYHLGFYNEFDVESASVIDATEDFGNKVEVTFTVSGFSTSDFTFEELEDGTYAVTGYNGTDTNIVFPSEYRGKKVTKIGGNASYENCLSVVIPDGITTIGSYAFSGSRVQSVEMPDSVVKIEEGAFERCFDLKDITIPDSITTIERSVFSECHSLASLEIPSSVTSIGESAFRNCGFEDITIPDSVKTIGQEAFWMCNSAESVSISKSVAEIGYGAFKSCSSLTRIDVDEENADYMDIDGILCTKDGKTLLQFPAGLDISSYEVPTGITTIATYAFSDCKFVKTITLPEGLTTIEKSAFDSQYVENINIPNSVTTIQSGAFQYCNSLKSIVIPEGITSIGDGMFLFCHSLESVSVPDSVTSIGFGAFQYCTSLTSLTIPKSVTKIDEKVFLGCSPDLTIYGYKGTVAETYANDNEITFVALDKEDEVTDSSVSTNPAEITTDTNAENGNTPNSDTNNDKNEPTGVVLALLPAAFAAVGMILSKKRK